MTRQLPKALTIQNLVAASVEGDIVVYGKIKNENTRSSKDGNNEGSVLDNNDEQSSSRVPVRFIDFSS